MKLIIYDEMAYSLPNIRKVNEMCCLDNLKLELNT